MYESIYLFCLNYWPWNSTQFILWSTINFKNPPPNSLLMPHLLKKIQKVWWKLWKSLSSRAQKRCNLWKSSNSRPGNSLDLRETSNFKKQCPNAFLVHKFPKETQNTSWKLWKSQVLELRSGGPTRKHPIPRNNLIYTWYPEVSSRILIKVDKFPYF